MKFMARAKTRKNVNAQVLRPTPRIKNVGARVAFTFALIALELALIYVLYADPLNIGNLAIRWGLALASLIVVGTLIRDANGLIGGWGTYLASTKKGTAMIDRISQRYKWFWNGMSMWGIVLGLGILSYPFLKGKIDKRLFVFGLVSIVFMEYFVLGAALSGFQFITLPQLQLSQAGGGGPTGGLSLVGIALYGVTIVTGFTGLFIILLLYNAGTIVMKTLLYTSSVVSGTPNNSILTGVVPGIAPLIPGIDIPFFAGIAALAVLLIVHEFAHGILARIARVRLKSIGLLVLGIIPIGAFVEPDEGQVERLDSTRKSRILAAGSASNFVWAVIFFFLLIGLVSYVLPGLAGVFVYSTAQGLPAYGTLQPGMQILYVNGYKIYNLTSLQQAEANVVPGSKVTIVTDSGTYNFTAVSVNNSTRGYVGYSAYVSVPTTGAGTFAEFLYAFFSLSVLFNLSLAVINLFPIPMFDGWRLYRANIKNKKITRWFAIFIGVLFLINLFAWVLV